MTTPVPSAPRGDAPLPANDEQLAYWNGPAGQRWAKRQEQQDALLAPISAEALRRAAAKPGERALDCGCGCGDTTIALAADVGSSGHVLGIDISEPMLARARLRTPAGASATYANADATVYAFAPAATDLLFSRFGVMFFADPVRAFANMRTAIAPGGRLTFVCWRAPAENPWFMLPLNGVYRHVPKLPPMAPDDPGPFAFQRADRVREILHAAGFAEIAVEPQDFLLDLACGQGLPAAVEAALSIGPASRALEGHADDVRAAAAVSVAELLRPHLSGASVNLQAAVWFVSARQS